MNLSIRVPGRIVEPEGRLDCDRELLSEKLASYGLSILDVIDESICEVSNVEVNGKHMVQFNFNIP